jgi:glycosyltransferase involved in cell wall biosynthesis
VTHILIEYEKLNPTVHIISDIFSRLVKASLHDLRIIPDMKLRKKDIIWSDVIISVRGFSWLSERIANFAKKSGKFYILVMDDDLMNLPIGYPVIKARPKALRKIMKLTNLLLCFNEALAAKYQTMYSIKRYAVINTIIDNQMDINNRYNNDQRQNNNVIKIVYAANKRHLEPFNKVILPIFSVLCDEFCNQISFTFIGLKPDLKQFEDKMCIEFINTLSYKQYSSLMKDSQFDIGIAPLISGGFNNYKYYNKYIEYTQFGVMGLYSKCLPYTLVVKNDYNGFLCENTDVEWLEGFRKAISNKALREQCVKNAQMHIQQDFSEEKILSSLQNDVQELNDYHSNKNNSINGLLLAKLIYIIIKIIEYIYLSIYYFKNDGIQSTMIRIKNHIFNSNKYGKLIIK